MMKSRATADGQVSGSTVKIGESLPRAVRIRLGRANRSMHAPRVASSEAKEASPTNVQDSDVQHTDVAPAPNTQKDVPNVLKDKPKRTGSKNRVPVDVGQSSVNAADMAGMKQLAAPLWVGARTRNIRFRSRVKVPNMSRLWSAKRNDNLITRLHEIKQAQRRYQCHQKCSRHPTYGENLATM